MLLLTLTAVTLVVFVAIARSIWRTAERDLFDPLVVAGGLFLLFYLCDYFYLLFHAGRVSTFVLSSAVFFYDPAAIVQTGIYLILCAAGWALGDRLATLSFRCHARALMTRPPDDRASLIVLILAASASVLSFSVLLRFVTSKEGLLVYLLNLSGRAVMFESFTIQNTLIGAVVVFTTWAAAFVLAQPCVRRSARAIAWGVIAVSALTAILPGGRAGAIQIVFIIVLSRHYLVKPIKPSFRMVGVVMVGVAGLVSYVMMTRTVSESYGLNMVANVFDTGQVPQANNVHIIFERKLEGRAFGSGLAAAATAFVPSALLQRFGIDKRKGSNTVYTAEIWPARWTYTRSQVSLGGLGALLFEVGGVLAVLLTVCLGVFYRTAYWITVQSKSLWGMIVWAGLAWSIFQVLRGDFFHPVNKLFLYFLAVSLLWTAYTLAQCCRHYSRGAWSDPT